MPRYRERLSPGFGTLLAVCLLAPATLLVFLPIDVTLGAVAAVVLTGGAIALLIFTAPIVEVRDGALAAGRARIEVGLLGGVESFRGAEAVAARGTGLDARAWTLLRGWVDPVARITLDDPDDPAPYWVVSTRHPTVLAAAIAAERSAAAGA